MITSEQLKRVVQLNSDRKEFSRYVEELKFSSGKTTMLGLICRAAGTTYLHSNAARFNDRNKELVSRLNQIVIEALESNIAEIDIQLAEHISN